VRDAPERSDAELALAAAAGDDRAYATLVTRHKDGLYRLLRRYLGNADEAYEAAHEAFIAAWSALARYDPERPFGTWLRTIAINKARDRGRRIAVRRLIFGSQSFDNSEALVRPDPAMPADDSLGVGETQSGSFETLGAVQTPADSKQLLGTSLVEPDPVVLDINDGLVATAGAVADLDDGDWPGARELQRVG